LLRQLIRTSTQGARKRKAETFETRFSCVPDVSAVLCDGQNW
jgi:hypothetical protein